MKTNALMIAAVIALVGCASEKSQNANSTNGVLTTTRCATTSTYCETPIDANGDGIADVPTGTGTSPSTTGYDYGSTASISLNGSALARLFYNSRPVNPTNVRININLGSVSDAIIVSYVENGILKEAHFGTKHPNNSYSNAKFNGWVVQDGQNVWKGFFQDAFGAVVLVVDKYLSQGDGQAATILGGSLWFQNFQESSQQNPIQGPLKMCWEIYAGPYDCRSFLTGSAPGTVTMTSSLYPTTRGPNKSLNYEKLGDFAGISRTSAGF